MTVLSLDWRHRAACRTVDSDLFFPEAEPGTPAYEQQAAEAKAVCSGCPVRWKCRDYAVARGERHGIWAAMAEGEPYAERRLQVRRRARRNRERTAA